MATTTQKTKTSTVATVLNSITEKETAIRKMMEELAESRKQLTSGPVRDELVAERDSLVKNFNDGDFKRINEIQSLLAEKPYKFFITGGGSNGNGSNRGEIKSIIISVLGSESMTKDEIIRKAVESGHAGKEQNIRNFFGLSKRWKSAGLVRDETTLKFSVVPK